MSELGSNFGNPHASAGVNPAGIGAEIIDHEGVKKIKVQYEGRETIHIKLTGRNIDPSTLSTKQINHIALKVLEYQSLVKAKALQGGDPSKSSKISEEGYFRNRKIEVRHAALGGAPESYNLEQQCMAKFQEILQAFDDAGSGNGGTGGTGGIERGGGIGGTGGSSATVTIGDVADVTAKRAKFKELMNLNKQQRQQLTTARERADRVVKETKAAREGNAGGASRTGEQYETLTLANPEITKETFMEEIAKDLVTCGDLIADLSSKKVFYNKRMAELNRLIEHTRDPESGFPEADIYYLTDPKIGLLTTELKQLTGKHNFLENRHVFLTAQQASLTSMSQGIGERDIVKDLENAKDSEEQLATLNGGELSPGESGLLDELMDLVDNPQAFDKKCTALDLDLDDVLQSMETATSGNAALSAKLDSFSDGHEALKPLYDGGLRALNVIKQSRATKLKTKVKIDTQRTVFNSFIATQSEVITGLKERQNAEGNPIPLGWDSPLRDFVKADHGVIPGETLQKRFETFVREKYLEESVGSTGSADEIPDFIQEILSLEEGSPFNPQKALDQMKETERPFDSVIDSSRVWTQTLNQAAKTVQARQRLKLTYREPSALRQLEGLLDDSGSGGVDTAKRRAKELIGIMGNSSVSHTEVSATLKELNDALAAGYEKPEGHSKEQVATDRDLLMRIAGLAHHAGKWASIADTRLSDYKPAMARRDIIINGQVSTKAFPGLQPPADQSKRVGGDLSDDAVAFLKNPDKAVQALLVKHSGAPNVTASVRAEAETLKGEIRGRIESLKSPIYLDSGGEIAKYEGVKRDELLKFLDEKLPVEITPAATSDVGSFEALTFTGALESALARGIVADESGATITSNYSFAIDDNKTPANQIIDCTNEIAKINAGTISLSPDLEGALLTKLQMHVQNICLSETTVLDSDMELALTEFCDKLLISAGSGRDVSTSGAEMRQVSYLAVYHKMNASAAYLEDAPAYGVIQHQLEQSKHPAARKLLTCIQSSQIGSPPGPMPSPAAFARDFAGWIHSSADESRNIILNSLIDAEQASNPELQGATRGSVAVGSAEDDPHRIGYKNISLTFTRGDGKGAIISKYIQSPDSYFFKKPKAFVPSGADGKDPQIALRSHFFEHILSIPDPVTMEQEAAKMGFVDAPRFLAQANGSKTFQLESLVAWLKTEENEVRGKGQSYFNDAGMKDHFETLLFQDSVIEEAIENPSQLVKIADYLNESAAAELGKRVSGQFSSADDLENFSYFSRLAGKLKGRLTAIPISPQQTEALAKLAPAVTAWATFLDPDKVPPKDVGRSQMGFRTEELCSQVEREFENPGTIDGNSIKRRVLIQRGLEGAYLNYPDKAQGYLGRVHDDATDLIRQNTAAITAKGLEMFGQGPPLKGGKIDSSSPRFVLLKPILGHIDPKGATSNNYSGTAKELLSKTEGWVDLGEGRLKCEIRDSRGMRDIQINMLTGACFIDGERVTGFQTDLYESPTYQEAFGDRIIQAKPVTVDPGAEAGSTYLQSDNEKYLFVMKAIPGDSETKELKILQNVGGGPPVKYREFVAKESVLSHVSDSRQKQLLSSLIDREGLKCWAPPHGESTGPIDLMDADGNSLYKIESGHISSTGDGAILQGPPADSGLKGNIQGFLGLSSGAAVEQRVDVWESGGEQTMHLHFAPDGGSKITLQSRADPSAAGGKKKWVLENKYTLITTADTNTTAVASSIGLGSQEGRKKLLFFQNNEIPGQKLMVMQKGECSHRFQVDERGNIAPETREAAFVLAQQYFTEGNIEKAVDLLNSVSSRNKLSKLERDIVTEILGRVDGDDIHKKRFKVMVAGMFTHQVLESERDVNLLKKEELMGVVRDYSTALAASSGQAGSRNFAFIPSLDMAFRRGFDRHLASVLNFCEDAGSDHVEVDSFRSTLIPKTGGALSKSAVRAVRDGKKRAIELHKSFSKELHNKSLLHTLGLAEDFIGSTSSARMPQEIRDEKIAYLTAALTERDNLSPSERDGIQGLLEGLRDSTSTTSDYTIHRDTERLTQLDESLKEMKGAASKKVAQVRVQLENLAKNLRLNGQQDWSVEDIIVLVMQERTGETLSPENRRACENLALQYMYWQTELQQVSSAEGLMGRLKAIPVPVTEDKAREYKEVQNQLGSLLKGKRGYKLETVLSDTATNSSRLDTLSMLFCEFNQGFRLRDRQVDLLDKLLKGKINIAQMGTGEGKTDVFFATLALRKSDGNTLVKMTSPEALVKINQMDLDAKFKSLFLKKVHSFEFDIGKKSNAQYLRNLKKRLEDSRDRGDILITSPNTCDRPFLTAMDMLRISSSTDGAAGVKSKECLQLMKDIQNIFVTTGFEVKDEADKIEDYLQDYNIVGSGSTVIAKEKTAVASNLFSIVEGLGLSPPISSAAYHEGGGTSVKGRVIDALFIKAKAGVAPLGSLEVAINTF
ncbi:MAG: hypothetical protein ACI9YB_002739, partial [Halioglobus sp.]